MSKEDLAMYRKKDCKRKREAKVLSDQTLNSSIPSNISTISNETPYRNRQSYGKAIKRGMEALPFSSRKKQAVIRGLANRVGLMLENTTSLKKNQWSTTKQLEDKTEQFYLREDVSYTMAGNILIIQNVQFYIEDIC